MSKSTRTDATKISTTSTSRELKGQRDDRGSQWESFRDFVKKIAAVPKEELNEKLAEEKREKKEEKRAG